MYIRKKDIETIVDLYDILSAQFDRVKNEGLLEYMKELDRETISLIQRAKDARLSQQTSTRVQALKKKILTTNN